MLRANLREALLSDGYDRFRGVVEPLTDEFDLVDIALAAVSLIEGDGAQDADEVELFSPPLVTGPPPRRPPAGTGSAGRSGPGAAARPRVPGARRPAARWRSPWRERAVGPALRRRRPACGAASG